MSQGISQQDEPDEFDYLGLTYNSTKLVLRILICKTRNTEIHVNDDTSIVPPRSEKSHLQHLIALANCLFFRVPKCKGSCTVLYILGQRHNATG